MENNRICSKYHRSTLTLENSSWVMGGILGTEVLETSLFHTGATVWLLLSDIVEGEAFYNLQSPEQLSQLDIITGQETKTRER